MTTKPQTGIEIDNELITKILAGEERQFEPLMRRHNASLFRIAMTMLDNDMDAEDAMQSTYILAYQNLDKFRGESAFGTWLTRILINECGHMLKKRTRLASEDISLLADHHPANTAGIKESPVAKVINKELGRVLELSLLQIPEKYRLVFVMREVEGLNVAATAAALNISAVNVKVRYIRARLMLRGKISDYYKNDLVFPFHLIRCDRVVNHVLDKLGIKK
jgi:RNA polymerase sigma-70 factor (ECF subfamily)